MVGGLGEEGAATTAAATVVAAVATGEVEGMADRATGVAGAVHTAGEGMAADIAEL